MAIYTDEVSIGIQTNTTVSQPCSPLNGYSHKMDNGTVIIIIAETGVVCLVLLVICLVLVFGKSEFLRGWIGEYSFVSSGCFDV
jgi:hypothetical protein